MVELSNTVATTVAEQLLKTMKGLFSSKKKKIVHEEVPLTPQNTEKELQESTSVSVTQSVENPPHPQGPLRTSTLDMILELNRIESQQYLSKDPPHDKQHLGSTDTT